MDHLCFLCLAFLMLSRLFFAALWSPAGKALDGDIYCILSHSHVVSCVRCCT